MKNKKNRLFAFGIIAFIGIISTVTVFAGQYLFNLNIPRMQGYAETTDNTGNGYITGNTSSSADVYLEAFTGIEAVTFYAGALADGQEGTWSKTGGTISRAEFDSYENDHVSAPYKHTFVKGQKMGMRVRNHNWSLNTGYVSGVVDYH